MKLYILQLRVSNSKVKQKKFNYRVSNWSNFLLYFDFKLVTQSVTFIIWLIVSNSKCNFLFFNFDLVTRKY